MTSAGAGVQYRRYRAPRSHGDIFADPPLAEAPQAALANAAKLRSTSTQLFGQPVSRWLIVARAELVALARRYTQAYRETIEPVSFDAGHSLVLLTGHQPRLFHPGVWYKNFAMGRLAKSLHAVAIHLIVDNDMSGPAAVRVPAGTVANPRLQTVAYDIGGENLPIEERRIFDRQRFASFADQVQECLQPLLASALVRDWWPAAIESAQRVDNLGLAIAQARHRLEGEWGLETFELPLSQLCDTHTFRAFLACLFDELPRFVEIYNRSLREYKDVHRIRSRSHPAPPLEQQDQWLESPCWIWSAQDSRRKRLFVRRLPDAIELTDRDGLCISLPAPRQCAVETIVEGLSESAGRGIKVRPRALLTTMYSRLLLCDLFVHGIGGGKYDQLTDVLIQRFFGFEPPTFLVLSATAQLPIPRRAVDADELRRLDRTLRDLRYNPDRFVKPTIETQALIDAKRHWTSADPPPGSLATRHREVRQANATLAPYTDSLRDRLLSDRDELSTRLRNDRLLGSREFAFCLYPAETLQALLLDKR